MPTLKIAHVREQGRDIIIVPLERSFGLSRNRISKTTSPSFSSLSAEQE